MDLDRYLRRIRLGRWQTAGAIALIIGLAALADHRGWFLYQGSDWHRYAGNSFRVVRVVDSSSIDVDIPSTDQSTTRIWLWGIRLPEVSELDPDADRTAYEATEQVRRLCEGQMVRLLLERHQIHDQRGRPMAYVQLADGSFLNEHLLVAGLVCADDRVHHRNAGRYSLLEQQARHDKVGLWADADD